MLSTVAAAAFSERVVSSWKLDNSSTQTFGSAPSANACISASSAEGEILPQATAGTPAAKSKCAVSAVVVVLPLLPVMAMIFACGAYLRTPQANSSISETSGKPPATAAATACVCTGTPGEIASRSTPANATSGKPPENSSASGTDARSASAFGGAARLSATRASAPSPGRFLPAQASGRVSPAMPCLWALFPVSLGTFFRCAFQRIFSVDSPISTRMMVMIQKRTTTWVSFQPPSS